MAAISFKRSSLENFNKYNSLLVGNEAFSPSAFDLLETQVLASSASSVSFTGLGSYSDYKHLQLRVVSRGDNSNDFNNVDIRFNGDSGANYARHQLRGDGSSVTANWSQTSQNQIQLFWHSVGANAPANAYSTFVMDILDFSSTTKNTTTRSLGDAESQGNGNITLASGLYNSTSAVTSIEISPVSNWVTGSRFSLYGIKAA